MSARQQKRNEKMRAAGLCLACGVLPAGGRRGGKTLCLICADKAVQGRGRGLTCKVCGEPSHYRTPFCYEHRTSRCIRCGASWRRRKPQQKYCSQSCAAQERVGEKANHWKGGITSQWKQYRHSSKVRVWRLAVLARDANTCQHCGATNNLHGHHVKGWNEAPDLRYDVSNGLTLCKPCHGKVHGMKW